MVITHGISNRQVSVSGDYYTYSIDVAVLEDGVEIGSTSFSVTVFKYGADDIQSYVTGVFSSKIEEYKSALIKKKELENSFAEVVL